MPPRPTSSSRLVRRSVCTSCIRIGDPAQRSYRAFSTTPTGTTEEDHQPQPQPPQEGHGDVGAAMRRRCPSKVIPDYLTPLPSYQLSVLLDDLMRPSPSPSPSVSPKISSPPSVLPQGAHLVYFPPLAPASALAADGADADHVPPSFHLAAYGEGRGGRRLWSGGEVRFRKGWAGAQGLRLDGRPWTCHEEIGDVDARSRVGSGASKSTKVDIWRKYSLDDGGAVDPDDWLILERRTLAFVADNGPEVPRSPGSRVVKSPLTSTYTSPWIKPSPTQLFHFSALSYNAHFIHLRPPPTALVHGPLLLAIMLRVLSAAGHVESINYRNLAPLMVGRPLRVCVKTPQTSSSGKSVDIWVEGPEGGLAVRGKATMAEDVD